MHELADPAAEPPDDLRHTLDLDAGAARLVDSLSEQEARQLALSLAAARADSARLLDAAIDGMIAVVPRLIRGRVKKILVGR